MKHLLWGACAVLSLSAAACGGGSRPPTIEPMPAKQSACGVAAENVAALIVKAKVEDMTEAQRPDIVRILTERCEADAWSDAAVACLTRVSDAEEEIERCGEMLTEEQEDAVEDQLDRELTPDRRMKSSDDGDLDMEGGSGSAPKGAPAPPPPPDDPCGGGA